MSTMVLFLLQVAVFCGHYGNVRVAEVQAPGPVASAVSGPEEVVSKFLNAWMSGHFDEVWQCLDTASRERVCSDSLAKAYSIPVDAFSAEEQRDLAAFVSGEGVIIPRPLSVEKVKLHEKSGNEAWVDCEVTVSLQATIGIKASSVVRQVLEQVLREKDGLEKGGWLLLLVLAFGSSDMDKCWTVRTAAGETADFRSLVNKRITLHVCRYKLICENGEWRIANAVTFSDPPAEE